MRQQSLRQHHEDLQMRLSVTAIRHSFYLMTVFLGIGMAMGCRQMLGIDDAALICPPDQPGCKVCADVKDCGAGTECHAWACTDHACVAINEAPRKTCSVGVCSDELVSECVQCVAHEDCPDGQCRDHVCSRCDDGIMNGWETDVDCGGGGACKACLGEACASATECKSGFCADGACCASACDGVCSFCGFPFKGNCSSIPKYSDDSNPLCDGNSTCDGFGSCLLRPGEICASAVECASYRCEQSRCRKVAGESCAFPQECAEDLCVSGVCQK